MTEKTDIINEEKSKKERKDYSSLRAWQVGHELNLELYGLLAGINQDKEMRPWCESVSLSLRESVVQIMEAFRKFPACEKLRRYEASLFYLSQAHYTIYLGQELGLWSLDDFLAKLIEYESIVRGSAFYFIDKKEKKV